MDPKIIKKTQDALGKIIKRPPLTDKLLSKPPFRFLHDLCTSIIKTTGFMKGLYTDSEMNSDNVKDKDSKIAFLQRAIDLTSLVLGKTLAVKPSKIVAGHEPERTNEWLQAIAEAINKKVDNDEYVKKVLTGDMTAPPEKSSKEQPEKPDKKERERSADRRRRSASKESVPAKDPASSKKERHGSKKDRSSSKDLSPTKPPGPKPSVPKGASSKRRPLEKDEDREKRHKEKKERDGSARRDRSGSAHDRDKRDRDSAHDREKRDRDSARKREKDGRERSKRDEDRKDRHKDDRNKDRDDRHSEKSRDRRRHRDDEDENKENKAATPQSGEGDAEPSEQPQRIPRPSSAKGSRRRQTHGRSRPKDLSDDEGKKEEEPAKEPTINGHLGEDESAQQPGSIHWGDQKQEMRRMARPSSARPAPPRVKKNEPPPEEPAVIGPSNVPNIISDKQEESSDDDDIFVTKEEEEPPAPAPEPTAQLQNEDEDGAEHGGLVKKMMEAKEKLEGGSHAQNQQPKKTEIERSAQVSDATRRKEREMVKKEIEKLRNSIQTLTRSVNPLGKILDFVQEDLDSMQKELEMWKRENNQNQVALQREQSITESSIEPLRAHLTEIDNAIKDQLDLIAAVKSNVLKNDERITKMLGSITKS